MTSIDILWYGQNFKSIFEITLMFHTLRIDMKNMFHRVPCYWKPKLPDAPDGTLEDALLTIHLFDLSPS